MKTDRNVVTRFAPSPTGFMHVGGVRTAIYAWAFAHKHGGTFILRIEDTDKEREVEGSIEHIIESLKWLGITWDEGVEVGGPHGPYIQSQRLESYAKYARMLVEKGLAYPDPYTPDEVEGFRKEAEAQKRPFLYRDYRPMSFLEWDGTQTLRFKVPEIKRYTWTDLVRGELTAGAEALDDFILLKADGYPTYNFAHVIDDLEMGVTHIMRGEEFISSTPKFLSLYDALDIPWPQFATMPVILGPDGKKKLSKRDGAKDILEYRKEGYLPEAFINFLAFLGWNPGGEKEVMTVKELLNEFSLEKVQKGGARFDEVKLKWFNHEHMKLLTDEAFLTRFKSYLAEENISEPPYLASIVPLLRERCATFGEAAEALGNGEYSFLEDSVSCDANLLIKGAKTDLAGAHVHLRKVLDMLGPISADSFTSDAVKEAVFPYATEQGRASVLWPMRVALSGKEKSPDPFALAGLLGKEKTIERIEAALHIR